MGQTHGQALETLGRPMTNPWQAHGGLMGDPWVTPEPVL